MMELVIGRVKIKDRGRGSPAAEGGRMILRDGAWRRRNDSSRRRCAAAAGLRRGAPDDNGHYVNHVSAIRTRTNGVMLYKKDGHPKTQVCINVRYQPERRGAHERSWPTQPRSITRNALILDVWVQRARASGLVIDHLQPGHHLQPFNNHRSCRSSAAWSSSAADRQSPILSIICGLVINLRPVENDPLIMLDL